MLSIAIAQIKVSPGRPDTNTRAITACMEKARSAGADLVLFPEMAVPGYLLGDTWEQPAFLRDCEECGQEIIASSHGITVMFGNVAVDWEKRNSDGRVRKYNALFTAQNGALIPPERGPLPYVIKALMPNYREFDDSRHFFSLLQLALERGISPRELFSPVSFTILGKTYRAGCMLCEDGWSSDYSFSPMAELARQHVDFLVNLSSSPYTLGKNGKRHRLFGRQASSLGVPLFYVNCTGVQNNGKTVYTFDGSSTVYNRKGEAVFQCEAFKEQLAIVDLEKVSAMPPCTPPQQKPESARIFAALSYGIRAFMEGIGMNKAVIGASGGIDSAVSAALYAHVLGPQNVLLVNMPGRWNSSTTKNLAFALANNLGCRYAVVPIQQSVEHTIRQMETLPVVSTATGEESFLSVSSFMAENIQARDRSSRILAAAAAAFGGGFTCNANKAETTVGYSTLYGDQAGFLCALADLWKYQVYALAEYLNEEVYRREVIPRGTMNIVPCAELSAEQDIDAGKGDPLIYPYHDYLFRSFTERWNRAAPEDILRWYAEGTLEENIGCKKGLPSCLFPTPAKFIADLEHWWKLFCGMGIAKRIQSPPILAISRRAYGFDYREAQNGVYWTRSYQKLKAELLNKHL